MVATSDALARELRLLKDRAGFSFSQLADQSWCSKSSLERYLNGRILPPRNVVESISDVCGGDTPGLLALWTEARQEQSDHQQTSKETERALRKNDSASPRPPDPVPMQLPPDIRYFTGREDLIEMLDAQLADRRASRADAAGVTAVVGTAGVGKTALAIRWAHQVADRFPDGQLWINLRGYDPELSMTSSRALGVLLCALGVCGASIPSDQESRSGLFRSLMAGRRALLVLDNAATAEQVRPLLPGGQDCMVIVTSRDALTGLVARDGAARVRIGLLGADDSVALLRRVVGSPVVDAHPATMDTVVTMCARLPLALRIAADRIGRDLEGLLALVTDLTELSPLDALTAGRDRHSAVRVVVSWSYRALPTEAAMLFRRLSTLPGPDYDRYVAAALMGCSLAEARRLLLVLTDAHLVEPRGAGRVYMHDLLRAFGRERAEAEESVAERLTVTERVLDYYRSAVSLAMSAAFPYEKHRPKVPPADSPVPSPADAGAALTWLNAERSQLLHVIRCAAENARFRHVVDLAATLYRYLVVNTDCQDALIVHESAAAAAEAIGDRAGWATAVHNLGSSYWLLGRHDRAHSWFEKALDAFREVGDVLGEARALGNLGNVYWLRGRSDKAYRCYKHAESIFVEAGDVRAQAMGLFNLSELHFGWGEYDRTLQCCARMLELCQLIDDATGEACAKKMIGDVHLRRGQYSEALGTYPQVLEIARRLGHRRIEAHALDGLGQVCAHRHEYERAVALHEQALSIRRGTADRLGEMDTLGFTAFALQRKGDHAEAAEHYGNALASARRLGRRGVETRLFNGMGEVAAATSAPDDALQHHQRALDLATESRERYEQARAREGLACACRALGDERAALEHAALAVLLYEELGVPDASRVPDWFPRAGRKHAMN